MSATREEKVIKASRPKQLKYRPEIDGLRAIAIIAVLIFHFFPKYLPKGFVGVDLFFLISGFLITANIIQSVEEQRFQVSVFFLSRVRRLFPALFVCLILVSVAVFFIFLPFDRIAYLRSLASSMGFASNVYFWQVGGYFGTADALKPLLHTWSLAVEAQFYVIFPLIILTLFLLLKRSIYWVRAIIALSCVFSLTAAIALT